MNEIIQSHMACPNCGLTMRALGDGEFWCNNCRDLWDQSGVDAAYEHASQSVECFHVGQKVKWLWTQRSGWNLQSWVDGEVTKVTPKRVQIEAVNRYGNTVRRWVKLENVKPKE